MSLLVTDLRVYYRTLAGDVQALDGVTFGIADGEIMGLAGESGCGKSTLGKSLTHFDSRMRYIAGEVVLDGVPLPIMDSAAMDEFRFRSVSIIPQYAMSAMNPTRKIGRMTVDLLESRGVDGAAMRPEIERRLELVGLQREVLDRYPIELSGGMKQRMVMVISTLLNPSLLIADEITSALDVSTQKAVAETLVEFRDRKLVRSMMVITHDLSILSEMADTITVMYAGKLAEKAATDVIIGAPKHPYTRLLISSLPGGRRQVRGQAAVGNPRQPPGPPEPARRMSFPRSMSPGGRAVPPGTSVRPGRARPLRGVLEGVVTRC